MTNTKSSTSRLTAARRAATSMISALVRAEMAAGRGDDPQARRMIRDERMSLQVVADAQRVSYLDAAERATEIEGQMTSTRRTMAEWGVAV